MARQSVDQDLLDHIRFLRGFEDAEGSFNIFANADSPPRGSTTTTKIVRETTIPSSLPASPPSQASSGTTESDSSAQSAIRVPPPPRPLAPAPAKKDTLKVPSPIITSRPGPSPRSSSLSPKPNASSYALRSPTVLITPNSDASEPSLSPTTARTLRSPDTPTTPVSPSPSTSPDKGTVPFPSAKKKKTSSGEQEAIKAHAREGTGVVNGGVNRAGTKSIVPPADAKDAGSSVAAGGGASAAPGALNVISSSKSTSNANGSAKPRVSAGSNSAASPTTSGGPTSVPVLPSSSTSSLGSSSSKTQSSRAAHPPSSMPMPASSSSHSQAHKSSKRLSSSSSAPSTSSLPPPSAAGAKAISKSAQQAKKLALQIKQLQIQQQDLLKAAANSPGGLSPISGSIASPRFGPEGGGGGGLSVPPSPYLMPSGLRTPTTPLGPPPQSPLPPIPTPSPGPRSAPGSRQPSPNPELNQKPRGGSTSSVFAQQQEIYARTQKGRTASEDEGVVNEEDVVSPLRESDLRATKDRDRDSVASSSRKSSRRKHTSSSRKSGGDRERGDARHLSTLEEQSGVLAESPQSIFDSSPPAVPSNDKKSKWRHRRRGQSPSNSSSSPSSSSSSSGSASEDDRPRKPSRDPPARPQPSSHSSRGTYFATYGTSVNGGTGGAQISRPSFQSHEEDLLDLEEVAVTTARILDLNTRRGTARTVARPLTAFGTSASVGGGAAAATNTRANGRSKEDGMKMPANLPDWADIERGGPTSLPIHQIQRELDASMRRLINIHVFEELLDDPIGRHRFRNFLVTSGATTAELDMWLDLQNHIALSQQLQANSEAMHDLYLSQSSPHRVKMPENIAREMQVALRQQRQSSKPDIAFGSSSHWLLERMYHSDFQTFVKQKIIEQAEVKLGKPSLVNADGLGDCFCLTNPRLRDHPIVLASDGFSAVTGYPRSQIVGRNCRFLQGPGTAPESVQRIRDALNDGEGCNELLLNYRRDGTPFYCLLCIIPLRDSSGQLIYFVGGQTNVTSIFTENHKLSFLITGDTTTDRSKLDPSEYPKISPAMQALQQGSFNLPYQSHREGSSIRSGGSIRRAAGSLGPGAMSDPYLGMSLSKDFGVLPTQSHSMNGFGKFGGTLGRLLKKGSVGAGLTLNGGGGSSGEEKVNPAQVLAGTGAEAFLGSSPAPLEDQMYAFKNLYSRLFVIKKVKREIIFVTKDLLLYLGLPASNFKELYSSPLVHADLLDCISSSDKQATKALRLRLKNALKEDEAISELVSLRLPGGWTLLSGRGDQSLRNGSLHLTPLRERDGSCVAYIGVFGSTRTPHA